MHNKPKRTRKCIRRPLRVHGSRELFTGRPDPCEPSTQVPRTCLLVGGQVGTAHSHTKMTNPTPQQPTYMWRAHGHAHACTWAHETYGRNCTARITLNMEQYGAEPPLSRLPCIGMHDLMFPDPSCVSRVGSRGMLVRTPPSSSVTAASCRYYRTVGSSRGWR